MTHPISAPRHLAAGPSQRPLRGVRGISRRTLAIATVMLSMLLIVMHDLPASAATLPVAAPVIEGAQQVRLTKATLAATSASVPIIEARDDFDVTLFTPIQWPVDPATTISSYFGSRAAPCAGCSTMHSGVDWTPGYGAPVQAIADGVVVARPMSDWGTYVVIEHRVDGRVVYSGYAHLVAGSNLPVGTQVSRGDVIGRVGNTGASSGTHLHFSIILGDTFVDPLPWLRANVTEPWG